MGTHRYMTRSVETNRYNLRSNRSKTKSLLTKNGPQEIKIKLKNLRQLNEIKSNLKSKTTTTSTTLKTTTIPSTLSTTLPSTLSTTLPRTKHNIQKTKHSKYVPINPHEQYNQAYYIKNWESLSHKPWIVQTLLSDSGKSWIIVYFDPLTKTQKQTTVDYDDYKRVLCSTDNFNDQLDTLTTEKWNKNFLFVQYMLNHPRKDRLVVYLDAISALTTKYVHSTGIFQPHQLHVPNVDVDFLKKAPGNFQKLATFYLASLYEWMRDLSSDKCKEGFDVGGDYCCTFEGNQFIKPKADLTLMFQKGILAKKNGVLWLTFSYRYKGGGIDVTKQNITTWIQQVSSHYNYKMKCLEMGNYGQMVYCYYVSC